MTISITARPTEQQASAQKTYIIANRILDILERYRLRQRDGTSNRNDEGRKRFLPIVARRVEASEPIHMVLPAFPFKSPNNDSKVLGTVPDKGEEIALAHLNGMCKSIKDIYDPGAEITIASDGIVYNDLLGVPDRDVWIYSQTLRKISEGSGFTHIHFVRLRDLLGLDLSEPLNEESYISQAPDFRDKMCEIHTPVGFDVRHEIAKNEDSAATYRGYVKFLTKDLANTKRYEKGTKSAIKKRNEMVARKMMARGKAFAAAVQANFGNYVRLSIHPSSGSTKFSISLFPCSTRNMTPWHATTVYGLDGSFATAHLDSLKASENYELVSGDGVDSYFREKSYLYDWGDMSVYFEPLYPTGLIVSPIPNLPTPSLRCVDMDKVRSLAQQNSPIVLRGFVGTERDVVISKAAEIGQIREGDQSASKPSGLQVFTCMQGGSISSFSSSRQLFEHLPDPLSAKVLVGCTFSTPSTPLEKIHLITPHPSLGTPCLRYQKPRHDSTIYSIENGDPSTLGIIDTLMYDHRVCYEHSWEIGDVVINDPVSTIYTHNNSVVDCVYID